MKDFDEYRLWIDAYSPETIPMDRLSMYLAALAKLLGETAHVHFAGLETGSTNTVVRVEKEAVPKVWARIQSIKTPETAANDTMKAFNEINDLARKDNATAKIKRHTAGGEPATVLEFPGKNTPTQSRVGPFNQQAAIVGELARIGGKDASAHILIVDAEGKSWQGEVGRDLAKQMAHHLYKEIRVVGQMRLERDENGTWISRVFRVSGFERLPDDGLLEGIRKLRALRNSDWADSTDIDAQIHAGREQDAELR